MESDIQCHAHKHATLHQVELINQAEQASLFLCSRPLPLRHVFLKVPQMFCSVWLCTTPSTQPFTRVYARVPGAAENDVKEKIYSYFVPQNLPATEQWEHATSTITRVIIFFKKAKCCQQLWSKHVGSYSISSGNKALVLAAVQSLEAIKHGQAAAMISAQLAQLADDQLQPGEAEVMRRFASSNERKAKRAQQATSRLVAGFILRQLTAADHAQLPPKFNQELLAWANWHTELVSGSIRGGCIMCTVGKHMSEMACRFSSYLRCLRRIWEDVMAACYFQLRA